MGRFTRFKGGQSVTEGSGASSSLDERQFVFDADFDKNDSGEIISPTTGVEGNIYITTSTITSSVSITFTNFPDQTEDLVLEGNPSDTIIGTKSVTWDIDAPSGQGFTSAPTATVPDDFSFTANQLSGNFNTASATDARLTVSYIPSVFPDSNVDIDYNNISISTPTASIVTYSHTFSGGVSGTRSCMTLQGSTCSVGVSRSAGTGEYYTANNSCSTGCSATLPTAGTSSSCNPSLSTASQSGFYQSTIVCNIPHGGAGTSSSAGAGIYSCQTFTGGSAPTYCGGIQANITTPGGQVSGSSFVTNCDPSNPPTNIFNTNNWNTVRNAGDNRGTWEVSDNRGITSDSCTQTAAGN